MPITINNVNPTSTSAAFTPNFRGESYNVYATAAIGASNALALPVIETFPASFLVTQLADTAANSRHGIITAHSASVVTAFGTNISSTAAAQTAVPTISSGIITLTTNATYANAAAGAQPFFVTRIS
jgi:hypothetical protein